MERWGLHSFQLEARSHFNMTLNSSTTHEVPWMAQNQTKALIANLQLAQVQTLRTTHLTLGAFSLALTLLTVHRIISDARRVSALQVPLRKKRLNFLHNVHPAEVFPLVLACGAVLQQVIFVAVQSTSLRSVLSRQCRSLAMVTYPAIFLLGYITLVFGIEMAMRAFNVQRFSPRGKWNTSICLGCISGLLLATFIPTVAWPMSRICFGSLIWFPIRYELISIAILSVLVFFFLFLAALLSIQLMRTSNLDPNERIAASRMCYYLLINALLYILVLPVQIQAHRHDFKNTLATSRIAEVALYTSGIVIAFFHLFLRVNATRLVIKPIQERSPLKQKRPKIRFFGPSDLEMDISGPLALQGGPRSDSRSGLIDVGAEKNGYDFDNDYYVRSEKPLSPGSIKSQGIDPSKWPLPPDPVQTVQVAEPKDGTTGLHKRQKSSYSLFPTRAEDVPRLPATVYSPPKSGADKRSSRLTVRRQTRQSSFSDAKSITDVSEAFHFLTKPPNLFGGRLHRRDESTDSSATVQIGLRFSVAPATLAAAKCTAINREGTPPLRRDNTESSVETLGLPIQSPSTASSEPTPSEELLTSKVFNGSPPPSYTSPTGPGKTPAFPLSAQNSGAYLQSQRDKVLPPTPRSTLPGPPPSMSQPPLPVSGLRMNPISPATPSSPLRSATSNTTRSPTTRSPTARVGLGAGTMARSPPPNGWI